MNARQFHKFMTGQGYKKTFLIDLVKKDVSGIVANVTGQGWSKFRYDYQDIPKIRTLKRVYIKKENGVRWIMWEWERAPDVSGYECQYSGIGEGIDNKRLKDIYIYIKKDVKK